MGWERQQNKTEGRIISKKMNTKKRGEGREMGWENQPKQNMKTQ